MGDHYETLGVGRDASDDQIKKAYRRKAKDAHPDRERGDHAEMSAINRARDTLLDHELRARYDKTGEDEPLQPTLKAAAENMILQAFDAMLSDDNEIPAHLDPVKHLLQVFDGQLQLSQRQEKAADIYLERLARKAGRVKQKGANMLWAGVLDQRRARYEQLRAEHAQRSAALKLSIELLKEGYEGVSTPRPPPHDADWQRLDRAYGNLFSWKG